MGTDGWLLTIIYILLVMLSAYFSAVESAFAGMNRIRIKNLAENGDRRSKSALYISEHFDRTLSTILICNNLANIGSSSLGSVAVILLGETKGLLREAVGELLPDRLLRRKKSPYPKTCHPKYAHLLRRMTRALAQDESAPIWQICGRDAVLRLCEGELSPTATPWYGQLMAGPQMLAYLVQVDHWLRLTGAQIEL